MKGILYVIILILLVVIDAIWLKIIANGFYRQHLTIDHFKIAPAAIFYLVYSAALIYFVINPYLVSGDNVQLIFSALFFGFICYATYDLTSYAILKDFELIAVVVDIIWGMTITTIVSVSAVKIFEFIK